MGKIFKRKMASKVILLFGALAIASATLDLRFNSSRRLVGSRRSAPLGAADEIFNGDGDVAAKKPYMVGERLTNQPCGLIKGQVRMRPRANSLPVPNCGCSWPHCEDFPSGKKPCGCPDDVDLNDEKAKEEEEEEAGPEKPKAVDPCEDLANAKGTNDQRLGGIVDFEKMEGDVRKACKKGHQLITIHDMQRCMLMCLEEQDSEYEAAQLADLKPAIKIGCRQGCGSQPDE